MDIISYSKATEAEELAKKNGIVQWQQNTDYKADKFVINNNKLYQCIADHTSTTTFDETKFQLINSNVKVGADTLTGDIEIEAGTGIDLQVDTNTNKITVLNKIASTTQLGGVKQGVGVKIDADGTLNVEPSSPPLFISASTDTTGGIIKVTYSESLSSSQTFDIAKFVIGGKSVTINSVALDENDPTHKTIKLFITPAIQFGDVITIDSLQDAVKDIWGGLSPVAISQPVTNNAVDTIPPSNVSNLSLQVGNAKLTLKWTDPDDLDWAGTRVVRKVGSYPVNENDGVIVLNSTVKNQYQSTGYDDTGLINGTQYYYQLFPYDTHGNFNANTANRISATPISDVTPPADCTNISTIGTDTSITIKWTDPNDSDWNRTVLVRKTGSYPIDENDGTVIVSSTIRNQYQTNGFVDTNGIVTGTTYYYQLFPIDNMNNVNRNIANRISQKAQTPPAMYGVAWNKTADTYQRLGASASVPQPSNADTYSSQSVIDSVNFFNTKSPWKDMKRCVLNDDGTVAFYLDSNDSSKTETGTTYTLSPTQNIMVEIPKFAYKLVTTASGYEFWIGDKNLAGSDGFTIHPAFYRDRNNDGIAEEVNYRYFSAFKASLDANSKLASLSGKTITNNKTLSEFRTAANRGIAWGILDFNLLYAVQLLYLVEYAHFDSQTKIGKGIVSDTAAHQTGETLSLGNKTGNNLGIGDDGKHQISYRGIESLWGDLTTYVDGVITGTNQIKIGNVNFNDTGTGYTIYNKTFSSTSGYISDIWGDGALGFILKTAGGNSSSKLYDTGSINLNQHIMYGGYYASTTASGIFNSEMTDVGLKSASRSTRIAY